MKILHRFVFLTATALCALATRLDTAPYRLRASAAVRLLYTCTPLRHENFNIINNGNIRLALNRLFGQNEYKQSKQSDNFVLLNSQTVTFRAEERAAESNKATILAHKENVKAWAWTS